MNHNSPYWLPRYYSSVVTQKGGAPYLSSSQYLTQSIARSFAGVDNPRWKQAVASHTDASTPYTAYDCKILGLKPAYCYTSTQSGAITYVQTVSDYGFTLYCPQSVDSIDFSTVDTMARTKFYAKMASSFDAGTFVGELKSTIEMLHSPAKSLRRSIDSYLTRATRLRSSVITEARQEKRRLLRPGTSTLLGNKVARNAQASAIAMENAQKRYKHVAAELLLEANLGWRPLFQDIEGAFARLGELLNEPGIERFRARARQETNLPRSVAGTTGHFKWSATRYKTEHRDVQVQYKGAIYSVKHHNLNLAQKLSVEPGDLVVTGWNLLPYSFLVDYFVNVSDVLNALVLYQRIRYVYCVRTVRIKNRVFITEENTYNDPATKVMRSEPGVLLAELKKTTRTPMQAVPIPALTLEIGQSMRHSLNIAALVSSRDSDSGFKKRLRL